MEWITLIELPAFFVGAGLDVDATCESEGADSGGRLREAARPEFERVIVILADFA